MKYIVEIDGTRLEVELDGNQARVNGGPPQLVQLVDVAGTPVRLVTIGDAAPRMHRVIARRDGPRGHYMMRIDGRRYSIDALDERARTIRDATGASHAVLGPRPLVAPMPGLVVRVQVEVGDRVEEGQGIVVMEAMKMENELRAPAAGTVRAVHARVGAAVEKGAVLVEFT